MPACLPPPSLSPQARAVEDAEREAAANAPVLEEGEELCNCEFSLAYGAKILLNNATMRLLRGHRCVFVWPGATLGRAAEAVGATSKTTNDKA